MFEQIKTLAPDSMLVKELKKSSMNMYNRIPDSSGKRNRALIYKRYQKIMKEQILYREDEFMDVLTDFVKDYPSEKEIKKAEDLFMEVLKIMINESGEKEGISLAENIAKLEASITLDERNIVYREELKGLKKTIEKVISEMVKINWAELSEEESERLYAFSEVISTSNSIIDSLLSELSLNNRVDVSKGISVLLYLVLRANAYLLGKISHDSLSWTISAVQAYAYANATYLIAN